MTSPTIAERLATNSEFGSTIAREFVHRSAVSEVFLTGIRAESTGTFAVFAQWPRWHVFYGTEGQDFDSALISETLRQLTLLIAHKHLKVPLGMQFLMPDLNISKVPNVLRDPTLPAEVTARAEITDVRETTRGIVGLRIKATFGVAGQTIATGCATARIIAPDTYRRFRSSLRFPDVLISTPPIAADTVGHSSSLNVVLGESSSANRWPLRIDLTNPILFDHPLDHIPGMLLIEAARQASRIATRQPTLALKSLDAKFLQIAEFREETEVVLDLISEKNELGCAKIRIQTESSTLSCLTLGFRL